MVQFHQNNNLLGGEDRRMPAHELSLRPPVVLGVPGKLPLRQPALRQEWLRQLRRGWRRHRGAAFSGGCQDAVSVLCGAPVCPDSERGLHGLVSRRHLHPVLLLLRGVRCGFASRPKV
jgi:hypothetical protein